MGHVEQFLIDSAKLGHQGAQKRAAATPDVLIAANQGHCDGRALRLAGRNVFQGRNPLDHEDVVVGYYEALGRVSGLAGESLGEFLARIRQGR
jgi:hypothetical protein